MNHSLLNILRTCIWVLALSFGATAGRLEAADAARAPGRGPKGARPDFWAGKDILQFHTQLFTP